MPKNIQKDLSKLSKIIHPRSRKCMKLTKRCIRYEARKQSKYSHHIKENLFGEKLIWLRDHLQEGVEKYTPELVKDLIREYLGRFNEELEQIQIKHSIGSRKNRQYASREDIIKMTIGREIDEFSTCGIEMVDIMNADQLLRLRDWNGELRYLQNFKLTRYSEKNLNAMIEKENTAKPSMSLSCNRSEEPCMEVDL